MPNFTIYLIKDSFNFEERYTISESGVLENFNSVFNDGVTYQKEIIIKKFIDDKKIDIRLINKSRSSHNVYYRETNNDNPCGKNFGISRKN